METNLRLGHLKSALFSLLVHFSTAKDRSPFYYLLLIAPHRLFAPVRSYKIHVYITQLCLRPPILCFAGQTRHFYFFLRFFKKDGSFSGLGPPGGESRWARRGAGALFAAAAAAT